MIFSKLIGGPYDGREIEYNGPGGLLPDEINGMDGHCYRRLTLRMGTTKRTMWVYVDPECRRSAIDYVSVSRSDTIQTKNER